MCTTGGSFRQPLHIQSGSITVLYLTGTMLLLQRGWDISMSILLHPMPIIAQVVWLCRALRGIITSIHSLSEFLIGTDGKPGCACVTGKMSVISTVPPSVAAVSILRSASQSRSMPSLFGPSAEVHELDDWAGSLHLVDSSRCPLGLR